MGITGGEVTLDSDRIFTSVGEVPYEWRIDSDAIVWGRNVGEVLGVDDAAVLTEGWRYSRLIDPASGPTRHDAVMRATERDQGAGVSYLLRYALRADGDRMLWIEDNGRWFAGGDGRPVRAHGIVRVINERHAREERLTYLSRFDPVSGAMNRAYMIEVLENVIDEAMKLRRPCGFLLAAVDNLGSINEAYGFDIADEVVAEVAKRIRRQLRGDDHLARFSGNTFGAILRECTPEDLPIAANRLLVGVREQVVETCAGPVAVTATVGGVTVPRHARDLREMLSRAQDALNGAKARRRGSFQAYRPDLERAAQRQANVRATGEIVTALNARRIFLVYEPVVAITSRQPFFYECLMRIRRADGTLLAVNDMVPIAERLGLVRLLDHRVLELALQELAAAPDLKASLNVSAASTVDPDWWSALGAMLRMHAGVGERLTVEITETAAIHDVDETRSFVARVKDLGCRIAVDDFGAGHTSFRNLRRLGVDMVKIDGAFVQNLDRSDDDRAFVRTLIDLAQRLGLETVAEWVQSEQVAALLADWGCDYLQGALVGLASTERPWARTKVQVSA